MLIILVCKLYKIYSRMRVGSRLELLKLVYSSSTASVNGGGGGGGNGRGDSPLLFPSGQLYST